MGVMASHAHRLPAAAERPGEVGPAQAPLIEGPWLHLFQLGDDLVQHVRELVVGDVTEERLGELLPQFYHERVLLEEPQERANALLALSELRERAEVPAHLVVL